MAVFSFTVGRGRKRHYADNIAITGAVVWPRTKVAAAIRKAGGTLQSSVGRTTELLIIGSRPGKTKLRRAAELGVPAVDSEDLVGTMGPGMLPKDFEGLESLAGIGGLSMFGHEVVPRRRTSGRRTSGASKYWHFELRNGEWGEIKTR